ncbi:helix-turn-helix domain-containing protein [Streptomyces sp. NPDC001919]
MFAKVQPDKIELRRTSGAGVAIAEDQNRRNASLAKLRVTLKDALASSGLTMTQLIARTRLGKTTVHQAFNDTAPAPSARTIARLATALNLDRAKLLALQRAAVQHSQYGEAQIEQEQHVGLDTELGQHGGTGVDLGQGQGLGKPIEEWDPHYLGVHPATVHRLLLPTERTLPRYVLRHHDAVLAETVRQAAEGRSQMVVLVGSSSTGKTRACWEAVQPLTAGTWRLWHPYDPTPAEAAFAGLKHVGPRTVVWLDEAQHYFGHSQLGERIAAALHTLLTDSDRGPVLVLGTLWPDYDQQYSALPLPEQQQKQDPHGQVRQLLADRTLAVPEIFDSNALLAAEAFAKSRTLDDRLLTRALDRARAHGRVTQDLAGSPQLLHRYQSSRPPAKAILHAAMDARRLQVGPHLSQGFLADAATDYLSQHDVEGLTKGWVKSALEELNRPVHGKQAPLSRITPRPQRGHPDSPAPSSGTATEPLLRLADYLAQHGRSTRGGLCPPTSFWYAAYTHLVNFDDLSNLVSAAYRRHRLHWAYNLNQRAIDVSATVTFSNFLGINPRFFSYRRPEARYDPTTGASGNSFLMERIDWNLYPRAIPPRLPFDAHHLGRIAYLLRGVGVDCLEEMIKYGDTYRAKNLLIDSLEEVGWQFGISALWEKVHSFRDLDAFVRVGELLEVAEEPALAEAFYRNSAAAGNIYAQVRLAHFLEGTGDRAGAEKIYRQLTDAGSAYEVNLGNWENRWWPYGLDPDGTPSQPWNRPAWDRRRPV